MHTRVFGKKRFIAMLAALVGNGIFGFSFMFSRMALAVASPFVMLTYRFLIAALILSGVALISHRRNAQGFMRFDLHGRRIGSLIALGLVQPVLYFLCESYGISLTNATVSGVIIALIPIVALTAAFLIMKEIPTRRQVMFSLLSIAGVIAMTLEQSAGGEIRALGVVLLIGAVISGAAFNMMSRRLSSDFSALERTCVMMVTAALIFALLAVWQCRADLMLLIRPMQSSAFLISLLYLSLFSSILAFLCLNYAATVLPVRQTTAFCNVTTVLSVFAGAVFLDERITLLSCIAAVVIIIGVFGVQKEG